MTRIGRRLMRVRRDSRRRAERVDHKRVGCWTPERRTSLDYRLCRRRPFFAFIYAHRQPVERSRTHSRYQNNGAGGARSALVWQHQAPDALFLRRLSYWTATKPGLPNFTRESKNTMKPRPPSPSRSLRPHSAAPHFIFILYCLALINLPCPAGGILTFITFAS